MTNFKNLGAPQEFKDGDQEYFKGVNMPQVKQLIDSPNLKLWELLFSNYVRVQINQIHAARETNCVNNNFEDTKEANDIKLQANVSASKIIKYMFDVLRKYQ